MAARRLTKKGIPVERRRNPPNIQTTKHSSIKSVFGRDALKPNMFGLSKERTKHRKEKGTLDARERPLSIRGFYELKKESGVLIKDRRSKLHRYQERRKNK